MQLEATIASAVIDNKQNIQYLRFVRAAAQHAYGFWGRNPFTQTVDDAADTQMNRSRELVNQMEPGLSIVCVCSTQSLNQGHVWL